MIEIIILYSVICYLISIGILLSEHQNKEDLSIFESIFSPILLPIVLGFILDQKSKDIE